MRKQLALAVLAAGVAALISPEEASASSHREAPFITRHPKVDNTDFYMFRSYETGRENFVTIIANYLPLQDSYGGPNYFSLDPDALYEIHIDNTGDAVEDLTFQFRFNNALNTDLGGATVPGVGIVPEGGIGLKIGPAGQEKTVSIPFINANVGEPAPALTTGNENAFRNVRETFTAKLVTGNRRTGVSADITHPGGPTAVPPDAKTFVKPIDFVGTKTFGARAGQNAFDNYYNYSRAHIYDNIAIPGCTATGSRLFVGQRQESFGVLLGHVFDLVNASAAQLTLANGGPGSYAGGTLNPIRDKNITTIALEIPASCLQPNAAEKVVGGWATASLRQARVINPDASYTKPSREGGAWAQVSRLGSPLVNEVVIGIKDKDRFNSSEPKDDGAKFADYVTHPTLPKVLEILFGSASVVAPNVFPRTDLVTAFLTGVPGVNKFFAGNPATAEMLRLNVKDFGTPRQPGTQERLGAALCFKPGATNADPKELDPGLAGCDPHGFPNGRRPGDDVTDIALRVAMGYLLSVNGAPAGNVPFGDAVAQQAPAYTGPNGVGFPYLNDPVAGAQIIP
jgi:hypothetical protein